MQERLRNLLTSIVEWWKRFTRKQQIIIVSSVAVVVIAIGILAFVLTRPEMYVLRTCESAKEAASVQSLLDDEGIYYELSDDGLSFSIKKKDMAAANILLGSNEIATNDPDLDKVFEGGLSTTEADKSKRYQKYKEDNLAATLETLSNVEAASVILDLPTDDGTLIAEQQDASITAVLTLDGEMDDEQAEGLAKMLATSLGNENTDNVTIMDSNMTLLFAGGTTGVTTSTSSQLSAKQKLESRVKAEVKDVVLGTGIYQNVEVGLNLALNLDENEVTDHEYYVADGQDQGYLSEESTYESETTGTVGGVPGTYSNGEDDTTYMLEDGETTSQTITDNSRKYDVSERITKRKSAVGDIDYENSSLSLSVKQYRKYNEDQLKASGALDDLSFDEYRAQIEQQEQAKLTVDNDLYTMVANATGISEDRITIVAYEEPVFEYSSGSGRTIADYLEILLAVLIFALLGFVVFMSTRREKEAGEMEPELSVESLLQTTKEQQEEENLEDIGFKEKTEARVLIEKFVEERPEAVASLLRNWLNEDWE